MSQASNSNKFRSNDRILVLRPVEGKYTVNSSGLVDSRLFKGDNKLHAVQTPEGLWKMRYEIGGLPPTLKEQFTSFERLRHAAERYFFKRNVELVEVID